VILMLAALLPVAAQADVLTGTVTTKVRAATSRRRLWSMRSARRRHRRARKPVTLSQRNKAFALRVLGVPVGTVVSFPNDDDIFHNVFSLSPETRSTWTLSGRGVEEPHVRHARRGPVFCNIHPR
jgi:plastocyanin